MNRTLTTVIGLAAVAALSLAACGDDEDGGGSASGTETTAADGGDGGGDGDTVTVGALDSLAFDSDSYEASAGEVTFVYENEGSLPHTLVIEGVDGFKLEVGDTDQGSVELEADVYELFCDIPGHRGAGMEATLTVT